MPTPTKGPRLGGSPSHQRLMLANLAAALFEHGQIKTTEARAKRLRPYAEKLVTLGKRGDLHARRQVLQKIPNKSIVHELFTEIGPRYANRNGGYTRITKIGPRKGDSAPMAVIELVEALPTRDGAANGTRAATDNVAAASGTATVAQEPADAELADAELADAELADAEPADAELADAEATEAASEDSADGAADAESTNEQNDK